MCLSITKPYVLMRMVWCNGFSRVKAFGYLSGIC